MSPRPSLDVDPAQKERSSSSFVCVFLPFARELSLSRAELPTRDPPDCSPSLAQVGRLDRFQP